jgi:hypothetical protein
VESEDLAGAQRGGVVEWRTSTRLQHRRVHGGSSSGGGGADQFMEAAALECSQEKLMAQQPALSVLTVRDSALLVVRGSALPVAPARALARLVEPTRMAQSGSSWARSGFQGPGPMQGSRQPGAT